MSKVSVLRVPRFAEEAVERARLAVVPHRDRQAGRVPFVVLVGCVLLAGVAGLLMFNTHMQRKSFVVSALQAKADALHEQAQQLQLDLEKARDPQALAEWALTDGMVPPDSPAFLRLSDGAVIGKAAPSTGKNDFRVQAPPPYKPAVLDPAPVVVAPDADPAAPGPGAVTPDPGVTGEPGQ